MACSTAPSQERSAGVGGHWAKQLPQFMASKADCTAAENCCVQKYEAPCTHSHATACDMVWMWLSSKVCPDLNGAI